MFCFQPPRTSHPVVKFSCVDCDPMVIDKLPFDKYELEPSPLTQYILERKSPHICWQVSATWRETLLVGCMRNALVGEPGEVAEYPCSWVGKTSLSVTLLLKKIFFVSPILVSFQFFTTIVLYRQLIDYCAISMVVKTFIGNLLASVGSEASHGPCSHTILSWQW